MSKIDIAKEWVELGELFDMDEEETKEVISELNDLVIEMERDIKKCLKEAQLRFKGNSKHTNFVYRVLGRLEQFSDTEYKRDDREAEFLRLARRRTELLEEIVENGLTVNVRAHGTKYKPKEK